MKEPKRLAHRQAERNKARALKHWEWDEDDSGEPLLSLGGKQSDSERTDPRGSAPKDHYRLEPLLAE
jgi:hypothetical protein